MHEALGGRGALWFRSRRSQRASRSSWRVGAWEGAWGVRGAHRGEGGLGGHIRAATESEQSGLAGRCTGVVHGECCVYVHGAIGARGALRFRYGQPRRASNSSWRVGAWGECMGIVLRCMGKCMRKHCCCRRKHCLSCCMGQGEVRESERFELAGMCIRVACECFGDIHPHPPHLPHLQVTPRQGPGT